MSVWALQVVSDFLLHIKMRRKKETPPISSLFNEKGDSSGVYLFIKIWLQILQMIFQHLLGSLQYFHW